MFNLNKLQKNRGMTYVELIVVISIAALLSTVSLFNYKLFQDKVEMKTLANDIALKITEAQKSSISGKLPLLGAYPNWRPSYGIYFPQQVNNPITSNKSFYYFADLLPSLTPDKRLGSISSCPGAECISIINMTKGKYISSIKSYVGATGTDLNAPLHITFTRPNSGADFYKDNLEFLGVNYIEITLSAADNNTTAVIKIFPSGRVQIY